MGRSLDRAARRPRALPSARGNVAVARRRASDARGKRGIAFVVEALVLLAFLAAFMAVIMQLFGGASVRGTAATELDRAVVLATNVAEHFAADPESIPAELQDRGYAVRSTVARDPRPGGVLYSLESTVLNEAGEPVYSLATTRYVSGASVDGEQGVA